MKEKDKITTISVPDGLEDITNNPIFKPVSEYVKSSKIFEQEDERETEELKIALEKLRGSIDEDIIEESFIAQLYERINAVYTRLLWIYSKNVSLANEKIKEMLGSVEKYYVSKKVYEEDLREVEEKYQKLLNGKGNIPEAEETENRNPVEPPVKVIDTKENAEEIKMNKIREEFLTNAQNEKRK